VIEGDIVRREVAMAELDLSGRKLGDYVLLERIDQGGFGDVYRCDQPNLGRQAIVKVLRQRLKGAEGAWERFAREAQLASRLSHSYVAHIYAFGVDQPSGIPWIAMELVPGVSLRQWLTTHGPMSPDQFDPFFECVAQVVQLAHSRGIVHRDIKPSNIMVIEDRGRLEPKLLDFGIAKLQDAATPVPWLQRDGSVKEKRSRLGVEPADPGDPAAGDDVRVETKPGLEDNRITRSGAILGSPPYMAPEQWIDAFKVGPAADLYALGVVAYEALTGRSPFPGKTTDELDVQARGQAIPPLGKGFSPALDRVFQRALAEEPDARFGDALELAAALRAELPTQPIGRLRFAAQQWRDAGRPDDLLWRGKLARSLDLPAAEALEDHEKSFLAASKQLVRRIKRNHRLLLAVGVAAALGTAGYWAALQSRTTNQLAMQSEVEQGRAAVLHDEAPEAQRHLSKAYQLGDHSEATQFMLSRALQPLTSELARFPSNSNRMWSFALSPDGSQIATTDDTSAQIWDAHTYQRLWVLAHGDVVYGVVYSTDGARLATAANDGRVRIWDAASGGLVRELQHEGTRPRYYIVVFSPDGSRVAAIDASGEVTDVWDVATGALLTSVHHLAAEISSLVFSGDGAWLATSGGNDAYVLDTHTWSQALRIEGPVRSLSFDPHGPRLAVGTAGGDSAIWDIPSGHRVHHLRESGESVDCIAWSPNGQLVATASSDGTEQVFSAASGALRGQGNYLHGRIRSIEFDRTSKLVLAAGANGMAVVADVALGLPVSVLGRGRREVRLAHFDADAHRIVAASWDGAWVWDARPPYRRWASPPIASDCSIATSLEPDRRFIAVGCQDHGTQIWDTSRDLQLAELPAIGASSGDFAPALPAVSAAGDRAATARGNAVEIYEVPGGRLLQTVRHDATVTAIAFAATGRDLISGAADGSLFRTRDASQPTRLIAAMSGIDATAILADGRVIVTDTRGHIVILDPSGNTVLAQREAPSRVGLLRPSPSGDRLITIPLHTEKPAPTVLWDLRRYRVVAQLDGHAGRVFGGRFVRDGHAALTTGDDGIARLWDATDGRPLHSYGVSSRYLADAVLSPDGTIVVATGGDGIIRFWDTDDERPLWTLQAQTSAVIGLHYEHGDLVTRGFDGEVSRWTLPDPSSVIKACRHAVEEATMDGAPCATVSR
jgi:WD40 repeat protein/serine/threonine protein kinase